MAASKFFTKITKLLPKLITKILLYLFWDYLNELRCLKVILACSDCVPRVFNSHLRYCRKDFADISLKVIYIQSLTKESFIYKLQMFFSFLRILLCAMCGDEYPVELILGTMLQPHACYSNPEQQDTIMIEAMLGNVKKTIAVTLTSYHRKILLVFLGMFIKFHF